MNVRVIVAGPSMGSKRQSRTVDSTPRSNSPRGCARTTRTSLTLPSAAMLISTVTSPVMPARIAARGYSGCGVRTPTGVLLRAGAGGGVAATGAGAVVVGDGVVGRGCGCAGAGVAGVGSGVGAALARLVHRGSP